MNAKNILKEVHSIAYKLYGTQLQLLQEDFFDAADDIIQNAEDEAIVDNNYDKYSRGIEDFPANYDPIAQAAASAATKDNARYSLAKIAESYTAWQGLDDAKGKKLFEVCATKLLEN